MELEEATLSVSVYFKFSNQIRSIIEKCEYEPEVMCFTSKTIIEYVVRKINLKEKRKIIEEHFFQCIWCDLIACYFMAFIADARRAYSHDREATDIFCQKVIHPMNYSSKNYFSRKLVSTWNNVLE